MVPSLHASTSYPSTAFVAHPGGNGASATFLVQQQPVVAAADSGSANLAELRMLQQVAAAFPSNPDKTSATVHHLSQSPHRVVASPTAQLPSVTKSIQSSSTLKSRSSHGLTPERPSKRIKLEQQPALSEETGRYRRLVCDTRLMEMAHVKSVYIEHLTELFFLQNGGNIIDYFVWKKRPTMQLLHFLRSGHLDSEEEEEQEQSINNEVRVICFVYGRGWSIYTEVCMGTYDV